MNPNLARFSVKRHWKQHWKQHWTPIFPFRKDRRYCRTSGFVDRTFALGKIVEERIVVANVAVLTAQARDRRYGSCRIAPAWCVQSERTARRIMGRGPLMLLRGQPPRCRNTTQAALTHLGCLRDQTLDRTHRAAEVGFHRQHLTRPGFRAIAQAR